MNPWTRVAIMVFAAGVLTACGEDKQAKQKVEPAKAALPGPTPEQEQAITALKQRGASVDAEGFSSAAASGSFELVNLYLAAGVSLNGKDSRHRTPLQVAAQGGNVPMVELLLAKGADINSTDENGSTALMDAAWQGDLLMVEILTAKGAQLGAKNKSGYTALKAAREKNHPQVSDFLVSKGVTE